MFHVFGYRNENGQPGRAALIGKRRTFEKAKAAADIVARGGAFADVKENGLHVVYVAEPVAASAAPARTCTHGGPITDPSRQTAAKWCGACRGWYEPALAKI